MSQSGRLQNTYFIYLFNKSDNDPQVSDMS